MKDEQKTSDFLGLRTCIYLVDDLPRATKWYAEVFNVKPYFEEPFYVGFNVGGYELGLQPAETMKEGSGGVHTYWGVHDVERVYKLLLEAGASPHEAPQNVGGDIVVASVKDPWNNIIGIIFNPGFKAI
jgi:predicted enzyme related to lactoylglutathione lyase